MKISKIALVTIGGLTWLLVGCGSSPSNHASSSTSPSNSSSTGKIEPPKATLELPVVPLDIAVDMNGKISIQPRDNLKVPTPLGTVKLAVGGASINLQDIQNLQKDCKGKRLLIVRIDDKATIYELKKGYKINLKTKFNNKEFKELNINTEPSGEDESLIFQLISVPSNSTSSNSKITPTTPSFSICLTNDRTFVAAETKKFIVSICGRDKPTYYVGTAKGETDTIKLPLNYSNSGQHIAKNGNTSYIVRRGQLVVLEDKRVLVNQKIIRSQWN